jgi:hypothetical protein
MHNRPMGRGGADENNGHRLRRSVDPASLLYGREGLDDQEEDLEKDELQAAAARDGQRDPIDLDDIDEVLRVSSVARRRLEYVDLEAEIKRSGLALSRIQLEQQATNNELTRAEKDSPSFKELEAAEAAIKAQGHELDQLRKEGQRYRRISQKINDLGGFATGGAAIAGGIAFGMVGVGIAFLAVGGGAVLVARHFSRKAQSNGAESFSQKLRRDGDDLPDGPWKDAFERYQDLIAELDEMNERRARVEMIDGAVIELERREKELAEQLAELEDRRTQLKKVIDRDPVT